MLLERVDSTGKGREKWEHFIKGEEGHEKGQELNWVEGKLKCDR